MQTSQTNKPAENSDLDFIIKVDFGLDLLNDDFINTKFGEGLIISFQQGLYPYTNDGSLNEELKITAFRQETHRKNQQHLTESLRALAKIKTWLNNCNKSYDLTTYAYFAKNNILRIVK